MAGEKSMVKMNKMIQKKTGTSFLVVYVIYVSLVYNQLLSDLLTTSVTHGTFCRPSTKRGLILIGLELNTNARESFEHC